MYFHEAKAWMWTYCIYLGEYIDKDGTKYDLGVYDKDKDNPSFAIVYGPEDGDYISGFIDYVERMTESPQYDLYKETVKRYEEFLKIN